MKNPSRAFLVLVALCALLLVPLSAQAQSGKSVVVKQRDADITILENGDAQFVETWVVNFRNGSFTFAFREIPTNRLRDIVRFGVTENGQALRVNTDSDDNKTKFTWYFPDTNRGANFFSDTHTFILEYTVRGAMRIYPNGDQFWWKFIEKDRGYTIETARATVHLPATFNADQLRAATYLNTDEAGGAQIINGSTVEFRGGPFSPDNEWEIRTRFPHTITAPPEEWQLWDDRVDAIAAENNVYAAVLGVVLLVGGPLLLLVLWYLFGRDKPVTFQAEFLNAPPDDTPPGVVGTLLDERADLQDILATVADLAGRGYIRIREADGFGTPAYERTAKETHKLKPFEKHTLDALMRGEKVRRLEAVRGSFYYSIKELETDLYNEVVNRGFFPASPLATRDFNFRIGKIGAITLPLVGIFFYCVAFIFAPLAFFPLLMLELFFIGLLGLSRVMPQRTEKGAQAAARWNAFKRYLASIEKYTEVDKAQDQFAKYLPYTIAFGLEASWIEKFKQTTTPAPKWYVPYNAPAANTDWRWTDADNTRSSDTDSRIFGPSTSSSSDKPIFADNEPRGGSAPRLPTLNEAANSSFLALNSVSSNMFDFLNTSAEAFTSKPETRSTASQVAEGVGGFLNWVGTSSGSSDSGSSDSSYSSSSWSSRSSSSSSGSSSGGGGGGGGSSGFG